MTLPRKGRRNIVVDEHKYHWHFDPFRLWGNGSFVCVQDATGQGPLLKMQWVGIVLPNHVELAIRYALANGWSPKGGRILEIGANSIEDPVTFRIKPDGAPRYWYYDDFYGEYSPRNLTNPNALRRQAEAGTKDAG